MGSRSSSGDGDDICFTADKPHFFKIVVKEKLMLPKKFVMEHGSAMGNRVFLRLPKGKVWEMELSKHGRYAWFEKGWLRFVEHYSLKKGDLLLFQYQGCKEFNVMIICASWSDINCSRKTHIHNNVPVRSRDDGYVEVVAGLNEGHRDKRKSTLSCPNFHEKNLDDEEITDEDDDVALEVSDDFNSSKKMRPNSSKEDTSVPLSDFRQRGKFHLGETSRRVGQEFGGTSAFVRSKKDKVAKRNKESEIKRIGVTKSGNHYFSVVLRPSYVRKGGTLGIPCVFYCKQKKMILKVADKSWDVIIAKYETYSNQITRGWSKFAMENSLKVGDCCVFELLKTQANVLKVSISRKAKRGKSSPSRPSFREKNIGDVLVEALDDFNVSYKSKRNLNSSIENTSHFRQTRKFHLGETSGHIAEEVGGTSACGIGKKGGRIEMTNRPLAFEKIGVFESGNPYFNVVLHPSHVHNPKGPKLVVPKKFAVDHIQCPQNMMLKVEDMSWPVLIATDGESSTMRRGWPQFARENGLQVGDSCVFELLKAESNVLKVLISRHAG